MTLLSMLMVVGAALLAAAVVGNVLGRYLPIVLLLVIPAPVEAQQYVQNGTILYERYSTPYTYYWCGRKYTAYKWAYRQVLNYADKDWRQKALDIVDKQKERQSFEQTMSYLGAQGLLAVGSNGYAVSANAVSYPSATGNVLGGFTSLEYNRYGSTAPLDANRAFERSMLTIDQFERSSAENARRGDEIHSSVATLIQSNSEGARAVVELQETRALVKETLQGMAYRDQAFSQMLQSMKPQSSESFRYQSGDQGYNGNQGHVPVPQTLPPSPMGLTGEEVALIDNRCAVCHGRDKSDPRGGFHFDSGTSLSVDGAAAVNLRIDANAPHYRIGQDGKRILDDNGNPVPYAMPPVGSGVTPLNNQERELLRYAVNKMVRPASPYGNGGRPQPQPQFQRAPGIEQPPPPPQPDTGTGG